MTFFSRNRRTPEILPVLLPEPLAAQVDALLNEDRFVKAVKTVRQHTELGLVVATRAVRHRQHTP